MKKILCVTIIAVLVLSLCSCAVLQKAAGRVVSGIKSAVADVTAAPEATQESSEETEAPEATAEEEPEATSTQESVDVSATPETISDELNWPAKIPDYVPVFNYGDSAADFSMETKDGFVTYSKGFLDVAKDQITEYCLTLKNAGYEVTPSENGSELSYTCFLFKDSELLATIVVIWNSADCTCGFAAVVEE